GRFCKVRELPFQDQAPDHPGSRGVLLEWLHSRSVHASPHIPVRNPRKIRERSEAFIDPTDAAKDVVARFGRIDRRGGRSPCAPRGRRTEARKTAPSRLAGVGPRAPDGTASPWTGPPARAPRNPAGAPRCASRGVSDACRTVVADLLPRPGRG